MCLCFCFSTLSLNSSAVEYDSYIDAGFDFDYDNGIYFDPYTGQEVFYDEADGSYYSVHKPLEYEPFELFRLDSPCYPNFDINKLPWLDMPSYVQEIINANPIGLINDTAYSGDYKLPFMSINIDGTYARIITGFNLTIGTRYENQTQKTNNTPYRVSLIGMKLHEKIYANTVCYTAMYDITTEPYSIVDSWRIIEPVSLGDSFVWYYNYLWDNNARDFYFYGSNALYAGRTLQTTKVSSTDTDMFPQYVIVNNPSSGFASGTITYTPEVWQGYVTYFTPPSAESLQQATSKGIWETLKEIPTNVANAIKGFFTSLGDRISGFFDNLAEKIKGFFLPSEGFFDAYFDEYQEYFKDRFGILYEIPEFVVSIIDLFSKFSPKESGYSIDFPEVVMPVLDNGEWYDRVIIEETTIKFEFLEQGAFKTLYSLYRSVVWFIFIFALVNLIIRKSERFFGGGG